MTKRILIPSFFILLALGFFLFFQRQETASLPKTRETKLPTVKAKTHEVKAPDPLPQPQAQVGKKNATVNTASAEWKTQLENTLKIQGGSDLKEINIERVESLVWNQDGFPLNVESVIITLKGSASQTTTFRAMVDSQTGKILNTWDQPIVEYADPSKQPRIKIDPRYHQND